MPQKSTIREGHLRTIYCFNAEARDRHTLCAWCLERRGFSPLSRSTVTP
jgi:hypothetical protein